MAADAVSAGSAGSCSSSRIWEFCAVSIRLMRAWSRAAWASRSAAASASVAGSQSASRAARPGPKMRSRELAHDLVQQEFGGLDGARVVRVAGGVLGGGRVVRAPVVGGQGTGLAVGGAPSGGGSPGTGCGTGRGRTAGWPGGCWARRRRGWCRARRLRPGRRPRWPGPRWRGAPGRVTTATDPSGRGCGGRCGCGAGRRPCAPCTWG